jgi:capsular exopolysaccharide synthesis family protein
LARALARQTDQRVLIVDGDLASPSQHQRFDVPASPGLAEALLTDAGMREAVHPTAIESLYILPSGSADEGESNIVYSAEFSKMLATLRDQFQIILVDTPPLRDSGAGYLMASKSDGVLLVMASGRHRRSELRKVSSELAGVGTKVLGVCLTEVDE